MGIQTITNVRNAITSFFGGILYQIDKRLFIRAELKRIKFFKIERIVCDPLTKQLLNAYLEGDSYFMSEAMKRFKCHNICNKIMGNLDLLNDSKIENELFEFCGLSSQDWEEKIKPGINHYLKTKSGFDISLALSYLRGESLWELEHSREYILFLAELRQKSNKI